MVNAMDELTLVTGADCHLCQHGRELLRSLGVPFREVDVSSPTAARMAEGGVPLVFLPVLVEGTRLIAYGRLSEKRLRKELSV